MRLGFGFAIFLSLIFASNLARGDVKQAYYDSKIQQELVEFAENLVGTKFDSSICLPNTIDCENKKTFYYPWSGNQPPERIYYFIKGKRQVEQYKDIFGVLVETDSKSIILETKFVFSYDYDYFMARGIPPKFIDIKDLKTYFPMLKEYIKIKKLSFDETISFIDNGGLEFYPNLSSVGQRFYRTPRYPIGDDFYSSSIEHRSGFNFISPNWPDYLRVFRSQDGAVKLEYSNNGSYWVSDPTAK